MHNKLLSKPTSIAIVYRLTVAIAIILLTAQPQLPIFAEYECPKTYKTKDFTYNLSTHDIRTEGAFKTIRCEYTSLQSSGPKFEVNWSSTGKVVEKKWCKETFEMTSGHAILSSSERYLTIKAQGIQLGTEEDAKEFMNHLHDLVKNDAKLCANDTPSSNENPPKDTDNEKMEHNQNQQSIDAHLYATSNQGNKTNQPETVSNQEDESFDDIYVILLGITAGAAAIIVSKARRRGE